MALVDLFSLDYRVSPTQQMSAAKPKGDPAKPSLLLRFKSAATAMLAKVGSVAVATRMRGYAAGSILACGIAAPVVYPVKWGVSRLVKSLGEPDGSAFLGMLQPGDPVPLSFCVGLAVGTMCGVAIFANAFVEAPYQLLRRTGPFQHKPTLYRIITNG